jgi:hypothetical protein
MSLCLEMPKRIIEETNLCLAALKNYSRFGDRAERMCTVNAGAGGPRATCSRARARCAGRLFEEHLFQLKITDTYDKIRHSLFTTSRQELNLLGV